MKTIDFNDAAIKNILENIQKEIKVLAEIYDSRDLFGIAYGKFSEKIIDLIEEYK